MPTSVLLRMAGAAAVAVALGGCVAETPLSVAPGQGKSYTDLQRDDAVCRAAVAPAVPSAAVTAPGSTSPAEPAGNYYQCMQARGELVVANRAVPYPVYAAAPYYGYPYYGYYGYPYYGYGYPYSAAYIAPYVGLGIGFGFGGGWYDHGRWRGDRGFGRGFDHGFGRAGFGRGGFGHGFGGGGHGGGGHR